MEMVVTGPPATSRVTGELTKDVTQPPDQCSIKFVVVTLLIAEHNLQINAPITFWPSNFLLLPLLITGLLIKSLQPEKFKCGFSYETKNPYWCHYPTACVESRWQQLPIPDRAKPFAKRRGTYIHIGGREVRKAFMEVGCMRGPSPIHP